MFNNMLRINNLREKRKIKVLCRKAIGHKNEKVWIEAIDSLIDRGSEVDWTYLFSKLAQEKQNYCIHMLVHMLTIPDSKGNYLNIIKQIGEAAIPIVIDTFYNHVNTITTTGDFEKLQDWLERLLSIIVHCNPPEVDKLFIEIYQKSPNQDVQFMVLENLGQIGSRQAVEFIQEKLSDEIIYTRVAAVRALGLTKDAEVVPIIIRELQNNEDNALYVKSCLEALANIGDIKSIEILSSYLHKDIEYGLKEKIVRTLLENPHVETEDVEAWFKPDTSYEVQEILIKTIVVEGFKERISQHIIEYVTNLCFDFYSKGNDMYIWGIRLLKTREPDSIRYLASLFLDKEYRDVKELDRLISEFGENAFSYLKALYPLLDVYEDKARLIKLMAPTGDSNRLVGFIMENISDICGIFSTYIGQKDELKIIELIEIIGKALKDNESARQALEPVATLILSKSLEAKFIDEERFYMKVLYNLYKYFYFEELENYFTAYIQGDSPLWRYAFEALGCHQTDGEKAAGKA